jgi:hypothetical protein
MKKSNKNERSERNEANQSRIIANENINAGSINKPHAG